MTLPPAGGAACEDDARGNPRAVRDRSGDDEGGSMTDRTGQDGPPPAWGAPPPPDRPVPPPGPQPAWGAQPEWGGQPQWGAQPEWGAQPQWGGQPQQQPWGAQPPPQPAPGWGGGGPQMWLARPKPGIVPLRPISLGEMLDGAFQAIRTNPRTMIGVSAVVVAVATLLSSLPTAALLVDASGNDLFDPTAGPDASDVGGFFLDILRAQLPGYVVLLLATAVLGALLTVAVSNAVLGVRTGAGALWQRVRGRVGGVLALAVLVTLLNLAVLGVCLGPGIAVIRYGDPLTGGLLVLGGLLPAVAGTLTLTSKLGLAAPALLLEDRSPTAALARSWQLTRGSFWRVLGILVLTGIIQGIGASIVSTPFGILGTILSGGFGDPDPYSSFTGNLVQLLVGGVGQTIGGAVFYPFSAAVTTLLYLDLRMRREGLDVELVRHVEGGGTA